MGIWVKAYGKPTMQWTLMLMIRHFVSSMQMDILARHGFNFTPVELGTLSEFFSNKMIDQGVALSMLDSTLVGLGVNTIQC